jgi:hypothetical protein
LVLAVHHIFVIVFASAVISPAKICRLGHFGSAADDGLHTTHNSAYAAVRFSRSPQTNLKHLNLVPFTHTYE